MARPASARILLALAALAALALAGCGGGEAGEGSASAGSEAQQGSTATAATPSSKAQAGSPGKASPGEAESEGATGPTAAQGAGKQGKPIQLPKGEREPTATPAEEAQATVADIVLASPALGPPGESAPALPATYTCDGKDTWPDLQWQGVPADAKELILFAMNVAPIGGKLFFDWALAGLSPDLEGLESGELPKGAVQGQNGFGKAAYEICPPQGEEETYVFALYAIPKRLAAAKGFEPHRLREEALGASGHAGLLAMSYGRG